MRRSGGNEYLQRDGGGDIRKLSKGKDVLLVGELKEAIAKSGNYGILVIRFVLALKLL